MAERKKWTVCNIIYRVGSHWIAAHVNFDISLLNFLLESSKRFHDEYLVFF